jgi:hypothetical protein
MCRNIRTSGSPSTELTARFPAAWLAAVAQPTLPLTLRAIHQAVFSQIETGTEGWLVIVVSLLMAGVIWNLATWWYGLPVSSLHTLIGSILGVGLNNSLITRGDVSGVNWAKAVEVGLLLFIWITTVPAGILLSAGLFGLGGMKDKGSCLPARGSMEQAPHEQQDPSQSHGDPDGQEHECDTHRQPRDREDESDDDSGCMPEKPLRGRQ